MALRDIAIAPFDIGGGLETGAGSVGEAADGGN
jgi:hypothetical protein